jgi:hypothetical protein
MSGWQGWVYGWKLHLITTVATVWIPLAAERTAANAADNEIALRLLPALPAEGRFVLGDLHYNALNVSPIGERDGRLLVTTQYAPYPHTDDGVAVRRIFHKLRSLAIEHFNEQCQGIVDGHAQVPDQGLAQHSPVRTGGYRCLSDGFALSF